MPEEVLAHILDTRCGKCANISMALGLDKPFFCAGRNGDKAVHLPTYIERRCSIDGCDYKRFTRTTPIANMFCEEVLDIFKNYILLSKPIE